MKKKANHPDWALRAKLPGTELRLIRGKYYLYKCSSHYDKELKRSRKKTGLYLGRVTPDKGLIPPKHRQVEMTDDSSQGCAIPQTLPKVGQVKEFGLSWFIAHQCSELLDNLARSMPQCWRRILALAYCRLRFQSPLQGMDADYSDSYLTQLIGKEFGLSARSLTDFLKVFGRDRASILAFMRRYAGAGGNVIFDGTDLLSASTKMDFPRMSKTKLGGFDTAINLMLAYSTTRMLPVYYRLLPGNVKDITAFISSIDEFGDNTITAIGDKGFYSRKNIEELEKRHIRYIIALRRSTSGLSYSVFDGHNADGHFFYAGRLIKYSMQSINGRPVYLYYDAKHAADEETDYLRRVDDDEKENYTMESYNAKANQFGTIALIVSEGLSVKNAFYDYKSRCEVEQEIDVLKTDLDALTTYMQDNDRLEAWMFINFIALQIFYIIRKAVLDAGLMEKLSTREAIRVLCRQRIVQLDDKWQLAEASKKDRAQLAALGLPIT